MKSVHNSASALALCVLLAACGGGGSSNIPAPGNGGATVPQGQSKVAMTVKIPAPSSSAVKQPKYVSASTQSIVLKNGSTTIGTFNTTPTSAGCSAVNGATTCTFSFSAAAGAITLTVNAYDAQNGTGNLLSSGTVTQTLVAGTNVIPVTMGGVVNSIAVSVGSTNAGTAATVPVYVTAKDPDANIIIGPGNFTSPITLTDSDASGVTKLAVNGGTAAATATVKAPSDVVTLVYSGGNVLRATITPSAPGVSTVTAASFRPTPTAISYYQLPGTPTNAAESEFIVVGGDGKLWISYYDTAAEGLFSLTTGGTFTKYAAGVAPSTNLSTNCCDGLAGTPSGSAIAAWGTVYNLTASGSPVLFSITSAGVVTNYNSPAGWCPGYMGYAANMVADGSGGAWFAVACQAGGDQIGHVTAAGTVTVSAPTNLVNSASGITVGADGNVYMAGTDISGHAAVVQGIVSGGAITSTSESVAPSSDGVTSWAGVAQSADGDIWVTNDGCQPSYAGRIHFTPGAFSSGTLTVIPMPTSCSDPALPLALADDSVWIPNDSAYTGNTISEVIPNGESTPAFLNITTTPPFPVVGEYYQGVVAPDGYLYFTDYDDQNSAPFVSGEIARIAY